MMRRKSEMLLSVQAAPGLSMLPESGGVPDRQPTCMRGHAVTCL